MRPLLVTLVILTPLPAIAAAATFTGTTTGTFNVREVLDGTSTTATKTAPIAVTLTTDYSTMQWSINFNTTLIMSGGPTQSFETDLTANATLSSTRCTGGFCLGSPGISSPLSFPDANGKSGAGSYIMLGTAGWSLTDRIVSSTRNRTSPTTNIASGSVSNTGSGYYVSNPSNQFLAVANYPTNITLTPGYSSSSWSELNGAWHTGSGVFDLGHIGYNTSDEVYVYLSNLSSTITLAETLAGDFNDSKTVDMADYVLMRDSPGPLAPFLTSYNVWRSDFGASSVGLGAAAVPEPCTLGLLAFFMLAANCHRRRHSAN